jgi:hypothetical protein
MNRTHLPGARVRLGIVVAAALLVGACGGRAATPVSSSARPLPVDSARLLERAIAAARPAYPTQEQAIAAGAYRGILLAEAARPAPQPVPVTPAASAPARVTVAPPPAAAPPTPTVAAEAQPRAEVEWHAPVREAPAGVTLLGDEEAPPARPTNAAEAAHGGSRTPAPPAQSRLPAAPTPPVVDAPAADRAAPSQRGVAAERGSALPAPDDEGVGPGEAAARSSGLRGRFVVQVAAYRDRDSAERAMQEAARVLPDLEFLLENDAGLFRVVAAAWATEQEAREHLPVIRQRYPSAWVRPRTLP